MSYFVWGKGSSQHRACPHCALQQRTTAALKQQQLSQRNRRELLLSWWTGTSCTSLVTLWTQSSLLFVPAHRSAGLLVVKECTVFQYPVCANVQVCSPFHHQLFWLLAGALQSTDLWPCTVTPDTSPMGECCLLCWGPESTCLLSSLVRSGSDYTVTVLVTRREFEWVCYTCLKWLHRVTSWFQCPRPMCMWP